MATDSPIATTPYQQSGRFFTLSLDLMCVVGFDGYLKHVNPMWNHLLGWSEAELLNKPALSFVHPDDHARLNAARAEVQEGRDPGRIEIRYWHRNGSYRWIWWNVFPQPDEQVIYAIGRDITEQKQSEIFGDGQKEVLEMVAKGKPLTDILNALLKALEQYSPDMKCSVLLLDSDGLHLRHRAAPSLPAEYCRLIDGEAVHPGAGSCGTAAFRREAVIVEDIASDPLWENYRAVALTHGLRACWSTPIFDSTRNVLGTFAVYYDKPGGPTGKHRHLIDIATQIAAIAIIRHHDETALRQSQSRHHRLIESGIIGVMVASTSGQIIEANDAFLNMLGYNRTDLAAGRLRWDTLTPPKWRPVDEHIIAELQRCGSCAPVEKEYIRKDGSLVPVLASVALVDGSSTNGLCLIQDLTERKQTEIALQRSEYLLRLFVEHSPAALAMFDRDMKYLLVSNRYRNDFRLGNQQLVGRSHYEVFPEIPEHWKQIHRRCLAGASERCEQELFQRADGAMEWVQWEILPWHEPGGKVGGIILATEIITERKRAEAALKMSEEKFTTIFRNAPVQMAITDLKSGTYVDVNDHALQVAGFAREDVIGRTAAELGWLKPQERQLFLDEITQHGRIRGLEMTFHKRSGQALHGLVTGTQVVINGQPCLLTVAADITERKRAENALRERENYLDKIINNIGDPMFVKDDQFRFVLVNDAFCSLFNLPRDEIIGRTLAEQTPPEQREHFWQVDRAVLMDGHDNVCEESLTIRSGMPRTISTRKTRYVDDAGNKFVIGVIHDITSNVIAQLALKRSEASLAAAQSRAKIGSWELDIATQAHMWSTEMFRIFGCDPSSGTPLFSAFTAMVHPDDRAGFLQAFDHALAERSEFHHEYRIIWPDGSLHWIEGRGILQLSDQGEPLRVLGTSQDVTERKRLEEQLLQAQKMEAIGTLAGGIAHDFNNILAAIKGYTQLAREDAGNQPEIRTHLDAVLQGTHRAAELVKQITAFSRQQGTQQIPVTLQKIVAEALMLLRATIPSTVEIRTSVDTDAPAVLADPTQMHQIMMNLCTNAWHAMKSKPGLMEIDVTTVQLDEKFTRLHPNLKPGKHVCISITDNGDGMDQATQARIFEPFFTTKAPGEGSGLGLAVVHGIVNAHHGSIVVKSSPQAGTTFELYFPALADQQPGEISVPAALTGDVAQGHGERVLLVDDEPALVELGVTILEKFGYAVSAFTSSNDALESVRAMPDGVDLVISDLSMPGISGIDFVEHVRRLRPDIPVIIVSGYVDAAMQARIAALGIQKLLLKPFTVDSVGQAVDEALTAKIRH